MGQETSKKTGEAALTETALMTPQCSKAKVLLIQDSNFPLIPVGSKVALKSVSFSKLEAGDFIVTSQDGMMGVRRFLRLDLSKGSTRLIVAPGAKEEESIPFTRLVGRIEAVRRGERKINPNPRNVFQRLAFRFAHTFTQAV